MPLLGPLVAYLPTPRGPEGDVRTEPLEELADRAIRAGVSGIAVLGSTGGYPYLTAPERTRVVEAAVPGVGGVKDRGSDAAELRDRVRALSAAVPEHVEIGCSGDVLGVEGLLAGARTWHSGLASVLPDWYVALATAAAQGRADDAGALMSRLAPFAERVAALGGPRAVHAVARLVGVDVGVLPAPLRPVDRDGVAALDEALTTLGTPTA